MPHIFVCSLALLEDHIEEHKPWGVVSLLSPGSMIETPAKIDPSQHLKLAINDIDMALPGQTSPAADHVAELLDFVQAWDQKAPLVIHCWAGISRSTASAYITLCALNPDVDEVKIAKALRVASPTASPNRLLVSHADDLLRRKGKMIQGIAKIGRGEEAWEARPFVLPANLRA